MISVVMHNLAAGLAPEEITQHYPPLNKQQVSACIVYAA